MNFDKESKSGFFFFFWRGGGGGVGGGRALAETKQNSFARLEGGGGGGGGVTSVSAALVSRHFLYLIIYKISSSYFRWFTSFKTNKRSNGQERDVTLQMFYGIQSKVNQVI